MMMMIDEMKWNEIKLIVSLSSSSLLKAVCSWVSSHFSDIEHFIQGSMNVHLTARRDSSLASRVGNFIRNHIVSEWCDGRKVTAKSYCMSWNIFFFVEFGLSGHKKWVKRLNEVLLTSKIDGYVMTTLFSYNLYIFVLFNIKKII
jgi:hypothetical protein